MQVGSIFTGSALLSFVRYVLVIPAELCRRRAEPPNSYKYLSYSISLFVVPQIHVRSTSRYTETLFPR